MQIGLGLWLGTRQVSGASGPFDPASLFAAGEQGGWYDPSDLTTMFQDTAGTVLVTATGQTVGLLLDKSRNGVGTNGAFRKNLLVRTEEFDNAAWTKTSGSITANSVTAPDGTLTADTLNSTAAATGGPRLTQSPAITGGISYTLSAYFKANGTNFAFLSLRTSGVNWAGAEFDLANGTVNRNASSGNVAYVGATITSEGDGWYRCTVTTTPTNSVAAGSGFMFFGASDGSAAFVGGFPQFTNAGTETIYVWGAQAEEAATATSYQFITSDWVATIPGNHLTQATAASRPIYGIEPFGGRRNLLVRTEEFQLWSSSSTTVTTDTTVAPDGTTTADTLTSTVSTAYVFQNASFTGDGTKSVSVFLKAGTSTITAIQLRDTTTPAAARALVNVTWSGGVATAVASVGTVEGLDPYPNGWYRLRILAPGVIAANANQLRIQPDIVASPGTGSVIAWGAQTENNSTSTAYQRVTDQWNVTEEGVPSVSYVQHDGTDDWFISPTITPGINKAQVFAGVRKLAETSGMLLESSTSAQSNQGSFLFRAPSSATANYSVSSGGTSLIGATATASGYPAPITNVVSFQSDIAGPSLVLRVNNAQVASSTNSQGTGNFNAYPLYVGRRGGTSLPFNGRLYQMIVRFGANLDASTIAATETFVNSKTGAY